MVKKGRFIERPTFLWLARKDGVYFSLRFSCFFEFKISCRRPKTPRVKIKFVVMFTGTCLYKNPAEIYVQLQCEDRLCPSWYCDQSELEIHSILRCSPQIWSEYPYPEAYPKTDALWRLIPVQPLRYSGWALTNRLHGKTAVSRAMFFVNIYII